MAKLTLAPLKLAYISSKLSQGNARDSGWLYVGQRGKSRYRSFLEFDLKPVLEGTNIQRAMLRIHLAKGCQSKTAAIVTPVYVYSAWGESDIAWENPPLVNQSVKGPAARISVGWNALDITDIVQHWAENADSNFGIMLRTEEIVDDVVGFDVLPPGHRPWLSVQFEETDEWADGCCCDVYAVSDQQDHTRWKQTCDHSMYTFFVENMAGSDVRLHVQISPDRHAIADESEQFVVLPGQTQAIVAQKFAYYTRLVFQAAQPHTHATIKVWFQPLIER